MSHLVDALSKTTGIIFANIELYMLRISSLILVSGIYLVLVDDFFLVEGGHVMLVCFGFF